MNWISALSAWQWGVLLAIPPLIVALYFLKLRRPRQVVPSTYLWRRTIEDMQVNSLWQRLRQNLLLWLQLLFLAAIILACLRPGIAGSLREQERRIYLLDASASMQATDVEPNRFEVAKQAIAEELEAMGGDEAAMLIAFSDRADVRQGFTSDRYRLLAALEGIEVTNRTSDVSEALRAASGLAAPGRRSFDDATDLQVAEAKPAEVRLYSDGKFPAVNDIDLENLNVKYFPQGDPLAANVAVVAFEIIRGQGADSPGEAFARVHNSGPEDASVEISFLYGENLVNASALEIPTGEDRGVSFELSRVDSDLPYTLSVELADGEPASRDMLAVDNTARVLLRPSRRSRVMIVTEGDSMLANLSAVPAVRQQMDLLVVSPDLYERWATAEFDAAAVSMAGGVDVVLFDGHSPSKLPPTNAIFFGAYAIPGDRWSFAPPAGPTIVVDWDRSHPVTQYLTLGSLRIVQSRAVEPPEDGRTIVRGDNGPLIVVAPRGPFQDIVIGFGLKTQLEGKTITNTDWPITRSFPIFLDTAFRYLSGIIDGRDSLSVQPGEPVLLTALPAGQQLELIDAAERVHPIDVDANGRFVWTGTDTLGVYRVRGELDTPAGEASAAASTGEVTLDAFSVNLYSKPESEIAAAADVGLNYRNIEGEAARSDQRREYWRWILAAGLVLLCCEWLVYNRKLG